MCSFVPAVRAGAKPCYATLSEVLVEGAESLHNEAAKEEVTVIGDPANGTDTVGHAA